ncbi:MAG: bacillithiol biosynthesis cysteine-adding enzyme BshC [Saprospiraceae bacterium]|nr:bacillithiol biosynthesis cysteine-adding enzyme BshC [Saprospiraceae bacterium]
MKKTIVPFTQIPQLSKTDIAYATGSPTLKPFFTYSPTLPTFDTVLDVRSRFSVPRVDLVNVLIEQYSSLDQHPAVINNLTALQDENTFTITTAHQPCFLLGPLYFIYKALTTINLAEEISRQNKQGKKVIPVFVLGSEDHDLEELNHANLFGKRITWEPGLGGPVGSMPASTTQAALTEVQTMLGESEAAQALFRKVSDAYSGTRNFAEATQALLNEFFGAFGLVVLNMNHADLKKHFIPVIQAELTDQPSFRFVNETIQKLQEAGFKTQASPREINLFYMHEGGRERIVRENETFRILNTHFVFSKAEMLAEVENHPEKFSPNVVLRPLFQEMILPNLAYVGGGGELAYWLERKSQFEHFGIHFPMLVRRHSVLWLDKEVQKKLDKFGFNAQELFNDSEMLIREFVSKNADAEVSLASELKSLETIYESVAAKAAAIDPTLDKAVRADLVKTAASLQQWESRLLRAEKQKHEVSINQLRALKAKLFPANGLQERSDNFLPYLLKYGDAFLQTLKSNLNSFDPGFIVLQQEA